MRFCSVITVLMLFITTAVSAQVLTITVPDREELVQMVAEPGDNNAEVSLQSTEDTVLQDPQGLEITEPPRTYNNFTDELRQITMIAGAVFNFPQQIRIGDMPAPFAEGLWPTAELRTARSPAGTVLATYATTVDDAEQALWTHRLTAEQTAALAGKTGITELSFPIGSGVYEVWYRIPTKILLHVTAGGN